MCAKIGEWKKKARAEAEENRKEKVGKGSMDQKPAGRD